MPGRSALRGALMTGGAAALLSAALVFPFHPPLATEKTSYALEATVGSSERGNVQLFYDEGRGFNEADSTFVPVVGDGVPRLLRFPIPIGKCTALRFDPLNRSGTVTIAQARIVDDRRRVVADLPPSRFSALNQIARMTVEGPRLSIETVPDANDPYAWIALDGPINLEPRHAAVWRAPLAWFLGTFAAILLLTAGVSRLPPGWPPAAAAAAVRRPKSALALAAAAAVLLSSYPVVFFGKSFVSPNTGVLLLYETIPTLPGYFDRSVEDGRGSDVAAVMWWHIPVSRIERHAVLHDHELPLWNRYDLCGQSLIGQGQSMIGDPLHWATALLGGGGALAWDLKFLAAKWLLAFGVGLTVLVLTGRLLVSVLLCASSLFIGFFSFRLNHPAFFSLCYAPWILYALLRVARASDMRRAALWTGALLLADWMEINSGTVKEASMLTLCLNLAGGLVVVLDGGSGSLTRRKVLALAWAQVLILLISAPLWVTFLGTLRGSFTSYDLPRANQLPAASLVGFFEDLYYRQTSPFEGLVDPSANFLVLLGVLWAVACLPGLVRNRAFVALALAAVVPALLVYGGVPASAILSVPFIRNIAHIDNTFSCVLIVLAFPIAGLGLGELAACAREGAWAARFTTVLVLLAGLLALYFGSHRHLAPSAFFKGYAPTLVAALVVIQLAGRRLLAGAPARAPALLLVILSLWAIHWRHAQHLATAFDDYVFNPKVRVDLKARSPAVDYVAAHSLSPVRLDGLRLNLFPGYSGMYLQEGIYGIDALRSREYEDLAQSLGFFRVFEFTSPQPDETSGKSQAAFDALNVGYFLGTAERVRGWERAADLDLAVFRSPTVWPRAFFTPRVSSYKVLAQLAARIQASPGRPFAAVELPEVSAVPAGILDEGRPQADDSVGATDYALTSNTTAFTIRAPSAGMAVLTETWLRDDFRVQVNGVPASYIRVNHAFKGVYLSGPGTYRIAFEYWPRHFTGTLWAAAAGLLLLAGSLVLALRRAPAAGR